MKRLIFLPILFVIAGCRTEVESVGGPPADNIYRIALDTNPPTLDPAKISDTTSDAVAMRIFDTIVEYRLNENGQLQMYPELAESWEVDESGTKYTFKLRKGVLFHNGREMVAEDVRYSYERLMRPETKSKRFWVVEPIVGAKEVFDGKADHADGIKIIDDYTIEIQIVEPNTTFLAAIAMSSASIIPQEVVKELSTEFARRPVGTGAFRLVKWETNQELFLERFDQHHGGTPKLAGIRYRIIAEPVTQLQEYLAGNLEHCQIPPAGWYNKLKSSSAASEIVSYPSLRITYFGFHMGREPYGSSKELRHAVNYAVDREWICKNILEGLAEPTSSVLPPGLQGGRGPIQKFKFDPEKAAQLLEQAGYPNGEGLKPVTLYVNQQKPMPQIAERVQEDLRRVGISVNMKQMDWDAYLETLDRGEADFYRLGWVADYPDADNFLFVMFHSKNHGMMGNHSYYTNPEVDKLVEAARVEQDAAKREQLYHQAEELIVEDAPWLFICYDKNTLMMKPYIKNAHPTPMCDRRMLNQVEFRKVSFE